MIRYGMVVASAIALVLAGDADRARLRAAEPTAEAQAAAKKILSDWYQTVAAAKTLSTEIKTDFTIKQSGMVVQSSEIVQRLTWQRPQLLSLALVKGNSVSLISDGKQLYQYIAQLQRYSISDEPLATLAEAPKSQLWAYGNFGGGMGLIGDATTAANLEEFLASAPGAALVANTDPNDKTQHVRFEKDKLPIDAWFSADSKQLLRYAPDMAAAMAAQGRAIPAGTEVLLSVAYSGTTYDAPPPADAFAIVPPKEAEEVDDLFAEPPHKLLGKQAPAFEVKSLDGKPVKLSDHAGKVVILDFWATWCGPCVAALPKISAVAEKFKDRGVVFYAVNQQEKNSEVEAFLTAEKLKVPVAMDTEGAIGTAYGVEGIPQTVIIDKNGKVQVVHVGAGPDIGEQLTKDLEAVLAGKELADEKTKRKK